MERQIIIEGKTKKISNESSENYFNKRPRDSQISAWVSNQSKKLENRLVLENQYKNMIKKFKSVKKIPKPNFWGGYIVNLKKLSFGKEKNRDDMIEFATN